MEKFKCPCCECMTFDEKPDGSFIICPVCFWEDDPVQLKDETFEGGANKVSLKQAKANFKKFGACDSVALQHVRSPKPEEIPDD
ncbi:MAG: CPCC family cysteine-rich protein [Alphaproteobacteria bacterium]|nr:hydrolase [Alphaproteobacteria bacterium]MBK9586543.1 hydrolase [Alphaproteobacteria bacterium]